MSSKPEVSAAPDGSDKPALRLPAPLEWIARPLARLSTSLFNLRAGLASIRALSFGDFNVGFGNKAPYIGSDAIYLAVYAENGRRLS